MDGEETPPVSVTVETGAETDDAATSAQAAAEAAQMAAQGAVAAAATVAALAEAEAASAVQEAAETVQEIERANEQWHERVSLLENRLAETQETVTRLLEGTETLTARLEALLTPPISQEAETVTVTETEPENLPSESGGVPPEAETAPLPEAMLPKRRRWI